ncbi:MAG: glycosyltransferase, partial [Verrucomicrobiae bacterium]|nr:glycosyltransferase [Verrucomicrobiae bacterium]
LARWSGLRPQDIHVVPNGVDTDTYRPADSKMAVRQRLGWTQPGAVIITVARLAPEKDLATLLRAVALMPQVAWWLVGYGSEEESLRELARQLGLIDRVVFWGQRADIPDLLQAADVFALSSLSEGLSMALIEAAACGLPIVATDVGGNREIVQPPHAGRLVPPQDPRALATALDEILSDEALRKTLSANARQTAVDRFSVAAMVERYRMLYEMALRRHSSS